MSGEDVVDFGRLPLIVVIAKQQHQYLRSLVPVYAAAMLFTISWALLSESVEVQYLSLGIAVVLLAIGAWMLVTFRRVDALIATHSHRVYKRTEAWNTLVDELRESDLDPGGALVQDDAAEARADATDIDRDDDTANSTDPTNERTAP
jgi:ABC-type transport system involved in cytochrome bd biosynthesis fused ATPase/permease subunit